MRQFYTVSGEKVSENPVTGNTVAVKTEQGWSRAKVLSSKDGKAHLYLGRESKCPLISLKKLEPRFAEEKWFAMKINPSQQKMPIVRVTDPRKAGETHAQHDDNRDEEKE